MSAASAADRVGDWMQVKGGRPYWPLSPTWTDVDIRDIAWSLSHICRFGGHSNRYYSVLEHSVLVSQVVPPSLALQGLCHDFTEAYVGDVVRPLKQNLVDYGPIEHANWLAIADALHLPRGLHPCVKHADNLVLLAERDALLEEPPIPWDWAAGLEPAKVTVRGLPPFLARWMFWARWHELTGAPRRTRLWTSLRSRIGLAAFDLLTLRFLR